MTWATGFLALAIAGARHAGIDVRPAAPAGCADEVFVSRFREEWRNRWRTIARGDYGAVRDLMEELRDRLQERLREGFACGAHARIAQQQLVEMQMVIDQ